MSEQALRTVFKQADDVELEVLRRAVDALHREEPGLIHQKSEEGWAWCRVVHSLNAEIGHRRSREILAERRALRERQPD